MRSHLEYHPAMQRWVRVFTGLVIAVVALPASGQVNGVPPSVTSFGFGGQPGFHGTPPSVTSLGPQGVTAPRAPHQPQFQHQPGNHHHQRQGYGSVYYVPYYVPYYPVMEPYDGPVPDEAAEASVERDPEQGGPTIFDRRGSGVPAPNDYKAANKAGADSVSKSKPAARRDIASPIPASTAADEDSVANDSQSTTPELPINVQPSTVLIFKDGHKQEVSNYAIVGANLFDLTPGHRLKIALADLDVGATQKANDDLGTDFKLPTGN